MTKKRSDFSTGCSTTKTRLQNDQKDKHPKRSGKLTAADIDILTHLAKFRMLTVTQLAALTKRSRQVVRRRLRYFARENLVVAQRREFGSGPGARENVVSVTEKALELLRSKGKITRDNRSDRGRVPEPLFIEHELLVNWFFIHLFHMQRTQSRLKVQPLITSSKGFQNGRIKRQPILARLSTNETNGDKYTIIPDGVFTISDRKKRKVLLFFLEVDRGTEPLVNKKRMPGDIRHKIICYQRVFKSGRYKGFEKTFQAKFQGFRLLFLINESRRMTDVCNLVQQMVPSDFIWATTRDQMDSLGLSASIWARGGRYNNALTSILGRHAFEASVLDTIR
ncbi:MAG: replication-relaxation family protein [Desulfobacteraceae bacterium]|jgi:DNA-binding MarR family transcriptional regulator|nr:replication-relaxation family protein [Desulfobacteraceae bacterium]